MLHGDGVKDVAFEVEDCIALYKVIQWCDCSSFDFNNLSEMTQ